MSKTAFKEKAAEPAPMAAPEAAAPAKLEPNRDEPPAAPPNVPAEAPKPLPPLELVGLPYVLKKGESAPAPNTIEAHCLAKRWPAWLCSAMAAQHPKGQEFSETEIDALARATAGLPLGRS